MSAGRVCQSIRFIQGGNCYESVQYARVDYRSYDSPGNRYNDLGLRLTRRVS